MKSRKQSNASPSSSRTSRRRFTKAVATTIVAAPLASTLAQAQKPTGTKEAPAPPNPQSAAQTQKPSPVAEAYLEVARARFGDRLTPEQFELVKKDLEANIQAAERLRAVKLKNEDEPDFVFSTE
jgi:DNA primase